MERKVEAAANANWGWVRPSLLSSAKTAAPKAASVFVGVMAI